MKHTLALALLIISVSCRSAAPAPSVQQFFTSQEVSITDVSFPSASVGGLLQYRAIVPATAPGERLPVLYFLHGANSDPDDVLQQGGLEKLAALERLIVIIPNSGNSYYTNAQHRAHARWEDAIALDLRSEAESRFPVQQGREHRGVIGVSMGGYGAIKLALKHPELYAFAASISGALEVTRRPASLARWGQTWRIWNIFGVRRATRMNEDILELVQRSAALQNTTWYVSCGTREPLYPFNVRFVREMKARGVPLELVSISGDHDWQNWNQVIPVIFKIAGQRLRPTAKTESRTAARKAG